jgi:hypothetical protein
MNLDTIDFKDTSALEIESRSEKLILRLAPLATALLATS